MKLKEKVIEFPSYMRDKLEYVKNTNLDILYQSGKLITMPLTNIELIVPHIIIFKGKVEELKLLYYGDYEENRNRFYTIDLSEEIPFNKIKKLKQQYIFVLVLKIRLEKVSHSENRKMLIENIVLKKVDYPWFFTSVILC